MEIKHLLKDGIYLRYDVYYKTKNIRKSVTYLENNKKVVYSKIIQSKISKKIWQNIKKKYNKSEFMKKQWQDSEYRRKQSEHKRKRNRKGKNNGMYGKYHSEETKRKISESKKILITDHTLTKL